MNRRLLFSVITLVFSIIAFAQPKQEVRAVWLTTNSSLDWPSSVNQSVQKSELISILDKLEAANFNTVLLQVQVKGDVLWDSSYQPSLANFVSNSSRNLDWNVCKFVIDECHKRHMECHAWIVPYRVGTLSEANRYVNNPRKHVVLLHPEWCIKYSGAYYLDPALPEVRQYLLDVYRELIANYDFDGTNFDYTRYPTTSLTDFDDSNSYAKYGNGQNKANWRRENINKFTHAFYDMAKSIKPHIKVGSAPIGTYKNAPGYGNSTAFDLFQDPIEWMSAGKHDIAFPQLYWNERFGFTPHLAMWAEKAAGRHIVAGLAPYKMGDKNNWDVTEVTNQISKARSTSGVRGVCFFRVAHVIGSANTKYQQLYTQLHDNYFKYPANIPSMDYNGVTEPNVPTNVSATYADGKYTVTWDAPKLDAASTPLKYYCVYKADKAADIDNMENCIGHYITGNSFTFESDAQSVNLAVTAFDANYYESKPVFIKASGIEDVEVSHQLNITANSIDAEFSCNVTNVTVFDAQGQLSATVSPASCRFSLDISHLQHGFYVLTVRTADGKLLTEKFIK